MVILAVSLEQILVVEVEVLLRTHLLVVMVVLELLLLGILPHRVA
jgi:hypothetical protein